MAESKSGWILKTIGIGVLAAILTTLLTYYLQVLIWGSANAGVSGGAASGVAVAVIMARRHRYPQQEPKA
jgi:uncharacterized membrane protein